MAAAGAEGPSALTREPAREPLRLALALALGALALLAATGIPARHAFAQPTTLKYLVTVAGPLLLMFTCLSREPLKLLAGAAIITAPWDLNVTLQSVRVSPVVVLLALAGLVAVLSSEGHTRRDSVTATVVLVAVVLLLPALAIGREQPHYVTWIASALLAGWLAVVLARQPGGLRFVLAMLVLAATVQGLVALYEYSRHANLNLYSAEVNQAVSHNYFFNFGSTFRPAGTLPDPDSLGNVLALACPLVLVLAASARDRIERLLWTASAAVIVMALILSFSRMSWIGAVVGVAIALLALPGRVRLPAAAGVAALLVIAVVVGLTLGGTSLRERFNSIQEPTARTNRTAKGDVEREEIWSAALASASAHPVVGTGMGRLQEHLSEHIGASREGLHAQSVYFQFLAETGAVGLAALLLVIGRAAMGVRAGMRRERLLLAGVAGAMVAMLITWTTDTTARYTSVSVLVAFLLGAALAQHRVPRRAPNLARP